MINNLIEKNDALDIFTGGSKMTSSYAVAAVFLAEGIVLNKDFELVLKHRSQNIIILTESYSALLLLESTRLTK